MEIFIVSVPLAINSLPSLLMHMVAIEKGSLIGVFTVLKSLTKSPFSRGLTTLIVLVDASVRRTH